MAISPFLSGQTEKREIAALRSPLSVIARYEAISPFLSGQTVKREIASHPSTPVIARNDAISPFHLPNPKERLLRRLAMTGWFCHREKRSDLAFPKRANREKRDCFAGSQ